MADTTVLVEFGAKIDALTRGVDDIKAKITSINNTTEALAGGFNRLGDIIKEAFSIAAIAEFIAKMAELGLQTERTMAMLGMSAEEVGVLSGMARITGTSMDSLAVQINRFSLNVQRSTADAVNPQAEALRVLGLRAKDLIGIPTSEYIDKLHDAVAKFNPSLNLTNALTAIGGRGFAQMVPFLQLNDEEWKKMKASITEANTGLAAAVPGMAATHVQLSLLTLSIQSASASLFSVFKPAIDGVVGSFQDFIRNARDMAKENGALSGTFNLMASVVRVVASVVAGLTAIVLELGVAFETLGLMIKGVFGAATVEQMNTQAAAMEKIARDLKTRIDEIWAEPSRITVIKPPGIDVSAMREGLAKAMGDQLKIIADRYREETEKIKDAYGTFVFTEAAKTQALLAALERRRDAEIEAGENINVAYAKFAADRQKILNEANKEYEKSLNEVFTGLQSAFNSQLRGMLAGTTSFSQGFKAIIGDMIIWAIQEFEKMAFKWIAHEIIQTTATQTGVAARTGSEAAGAATVSGFGIASAIRSIMNSAAETFAGVFAFLSPTMGPFAAGPATASSATVAAAAGGIAALDVGTDYVARTGLAVIHQGEAIVPSAQTTGPFTGFGSANVSLNISAVDARSFANLVNSNPSIFTGLIRRAMRDNMLQLQTVK